MKYFVLLFSLFAIDFSAGNAQTTHYGNNPRTGKYYNIRGIKMYCETYGSGKPLLLIHGNGGNISAFKNNIAFFAQHYQVIATDSRSQGKTVDKKDSLSFEMMADDEAALLDALHIDSAYVIGWSDGGIVALLMALRHPDKVIKLAATGTNITPDASAFVDGFWDNEKKTYDEKHNNNFSGKEKNDWKLFMLDWLQPNIDFNELKNIHCPSLIICGDHDLISIEHTAKIYEHIPNAYLWVVPASHHATLIEHTDEFNKTVHQFFQQPFKKL